jgi:hypothetical protein
VLGVCRYDDFCHTEMWLMLSLVKGSRFQLCLASASRPAGAHVPWWEALAAVLLYRGISFRLAIVVGWPIY